MRLSFLLPVTPSGGDDPLPLGSLSAAIGRMAKVRPGAALRFVRWIDRGRRRHSQAAACEAPMDELLNEFLTETNESLGAARRRAGEARTHRRTSRRPCR